MFIEKVGERTYYYSADKPTKEAQLGTLITIKDWETKTEFLQNIHDLVSPANFAFDVWIASYSKYNILSSKKLVTPGEEELKVDQRRHATIFIVPKDKKNSGMKMFKKLRCKLSGYKQV